MGDISYKEVFELKNYIESLGWKLHNCGNGKELNKNFDPKTIFAQIYNTSNIALTTVRGFNLSDLRNNIKAKIERIKREKKKGV